MNDITIFSSNDFGEVRTVEFNGEIWFYGSDVAKALKYTNPRKALIDHVWNEDKNTVTIRDGIPGNPQHILINESGLYSLIFNSKLETARSFSRWVTNEVLPSIRKYGAYISPELLQDKEALLEQIKKLQEENNKLLEDKKNNKVTYADYLKRRDWDTCNVATVAADFDLSARKLNTILEYEGVQYKGEDNRWHLFDAYKDKGYVVEEKYYYGQGYMISMKWTEDGCLFIADILSKRNIYPLVEKGTSIWKS